MDHGSSIMGRRKGNLRGRLANLAGRQDGFSMTELLIVIALLAIVLILIVYATFIHQTGKARDAKRKTDLHAMRSAFEEYLTDNGCYPPEASIQNCGGNDLEPYLDRVPCDPTGEPYDYIVDPDCKWYQLYTDLENDTDPQISAVGCENGCGTDGDYDYGIAIGTTTGDGGGGGGLVGPPPPPGGPTLACDTAGACNVYADPESSGCPVWFGDADICQGYCDDGSSYWCAQ